MTRQLAEQALDFDRLRFPRMLPAALTVDEALGENAPLVHEQLNPIG